MNGHKKIGGSQLPPIPVDFHQQPIKLTIPNHNLFF